MDNSTTKKDRPRVSVIIATHNYGHWLSGAIESVMKEGYGPLNICVVDDGSTDNTQEVLKNIVPPPGTFHTLKTYRNETPLGPSAARNLAIKQNWSQTDYFAILDADDLYLPGKIGRSVEILDSDPNIGGVYTDYDIVNMQTGTYHREYKEPYSAEKLRQDCIIHSACILRKEALEFSGLYSEEMRTAEDWHLWLRIMKKFLFFHIPEPLMIVRSGAHSSSNYRSKEEWNHNWNKIRLLLQEQ